MFFIDKAFVLIISYNKIIISFFVSGFFFFIKEQTYLRIQSFEFTLQFVHKYIIIKVSIFLQVYSFILFKKLIHVYIKKNNKKKPEALSN